MLVDVVGPCIFSLASDPLEPKPGLAHLKSFANMDSQAPSDTMSRGSSFPLEDTSGYTVSGPIVLSTEQVTRSTVGQLEHDLQAHHEQAAALREQILELSMDLDESNTAIDRLDIPISDILSWIQNLEQQYQQVQERALNATRGLIVFNNVASIEGTLSQCVNLVHEIFRARE